MTHPFAAYDHEFRFAGIVYALSLAGAIDAAKAAGVVAPMVERAQRDHFKLRASPLYNV